jgi:mannose/fructose/N-acetylgalactosamine-specific phosphotransferase system component IIC
MNTRQMKNRAERLIPYFACGFAVHLYMELVSFRTMGAGPTVDGLLYSRLLGIISLTGLFACVYVLVRLRRE